jgi:hypothetical protein
MPKGKTKGRTMNQAKQKEEYGHTLSPEIFEATVADIINEYGALKLDDEPVVEVLVNQGKAYEVGPRALERVREVESL